MIHFLWLTGIRLKIEGREKLNKRECYLFYANHSSMLDIPIVSASVENGLVFVSKKSLFMIPLMGWGMRAMGHIAIDRSSARKAKQSFSEALVRIKREHLSLILFPEGTRSVDGTLGEFKQGSFGVAFEAGVRVVPVAINGASACLPKKKLMIRPGEISIKFGEPIDPTGMDKHSLMVMVRERIAEGLGQSDVVSKI